MVDKTLKPDEKEILFLASLAPSGHNTQPWFVQYLEPYHWIIGNDKSKWLPAVDPTQRETILSIGTFIQNLEYAASFFGYDCQWNLLAKYKSPQKGVGNQNCDRTRHCSFQKLITYLIYGDVY